MRKLISYIGILSISAGLSASGVNAANFLDQHWQHYNQGVKFEKKGDYKQALQQFDKALGYSNRDPATLIKISTLFLHSNATGEMRETYLKKAISYLEKAQNVSKDDSVIYLLLAKAHHNLGDNSKAEKNYRKAITLDPNNILLKINLGMLYFEAKEFKHSIELLNKVVLAYPDNLKARSYLGAALQSTENYLAAIEQYNYVLKYEKNKFSITKNIGDCWLALGDLDRAKDYLLQAQKIDPYVPDLYADLAYIEQKQKNYPGAIGHYKKALELKDNKVWRKSLAYALWANNDLENAVGEFNAIEEYNVAAYINQVLGNKDLAIENYQMAIDKNPKDLKSIYNLGNIYQESGELELARTQYLKIIDQKPNDAETLFLLGVLEQERGATSKAIRHYEELLSKHLASVDKNAITEDAKIKKSIKQRVHFNLGLAYKSKNKLDMAEDHFAEAISLGNFERTEDIYKELTFVKVSTGKSAEAEEIMLTWLKDDPTNVVARNMYSDLLINLTREREAIEQLKLASVVDKSQKTRLKLASLLRSQNNLYDALSEYQVVLQEDEKNLSALLGAAETYKSLSLHNESMSLYRKALKESPDNLLANYNYGLILQENNKSDLALEHYKKVMAINPEFIENYYVLGLCYWDLEQKENAIKAWNKYLGYSSNEDVKREVVKLINDYKLSLKDKKLRHKGSQSHQLNNKINKIDIQNNNETTS